MYQQQQDSKSLLSSSLLPSPDKDLAYGETLTKKWRGVNKSEIISEMKTQMHLAGPLVVVGFLQFSLQMISVMFIGHLGTLSLSSVSMATSFAGVTGFSFMLGMASALETFCGQAYGAEQYHMVGVHMQRAMLVLTFMSIPIAFLWFYTEQIFIILKQDPQNSMQAGIYARWLIPSIFPYGLLQCQLTFLQVQSNTLPLMISTGLSSLVHVVVCWTLIFRLGLENKGAAWSIAVSYWINVLVLAIYIKFSPTCKRTWTGFSKEGMKNLVTFLAFAVPSSLMACLEFWSYEFLVFMSGLLPNPQLETSVMSISLNTSCVVFRICSGFGSAVSTRVSTNLGAGKPDAASLAVKVVMFLTITEGISASMIAFGVRNIWGFLYTNDVEVVRYLAIIMPVLALSNFMDGIQAVLSGTARGCGWQKMGAYVNFGAYFIVGLPCAIILTFVFHFQGKGLWTGIICGSALQSLLLSVITLHTNWEHEARKAMDRVYATSVPDNVESSNHEALISTTCSRQEHT